MLHMVRDAAKAAALLQPSRLRMLELLREPNSGSGLARLLDLPRQQVNYHLRELEKDGFVEFVEERRRGNCMERIVKSSADTFVVSPEVLGPLGVPLTAQDRFSVSYLIGAAIRILRELAQLSYQVARSGKRVATITLETEVRFRSAADRAAFAGELADAVAALTSKYHAANAEGGRRFRFVVGGYPAIQPDMQRDMEEAGGESVRIH